MRSLSEFLEEKIGYRFSDTSIVEQAAIHRSSINETGGTRLDSYERLEFLGDAVLELIISDLLYHKFPQEAEGALTQKRIQIVSEPSFAFLGEAWGLPQYVVLGHGEELQGGRQKPSIISDVFEAVCGAIYLDGGYDFLYQYFSDRIDSLIQEEIQVGRAFVDYKSKIQEYYQKREIPFSYKERKVDGPEHNKRYTYALIAGHKEIAVGEGSSKRQAQMDAAEKAWSKVNGRLAK
ncbi:MAG: ribonuclease III [Peptoniphilaceae bacterium]|nr:ribonuclease III [Peptoniphilaceae bacterium]MDY5766116.1 ribonuclease III [Peptoniphilaceae bacterium]